MFFKVDGDNNIFVFNFIIINNIAKLKHAALLMHRCYELLLCWNRSNS